MTDDQEAVARQCKRGAEDDTMTFSEIVGSLMGLGFEGYAVDFRRGAATYYTIDGDLIDLDADKHRGDVAAGFDIATVRSAIAEAQQLVPGYTYRGFCEKVISAGCAGYMVSISGQRALYYSRTGETHTELFPNKGSESIRDCSPSNRDAPCCCVDHGPEPVALRPSA